MAVVGAQGCVAEAVTENTPFTCLVKRWCHRNSQGLHGECRQHRRGAFTPSATTSPGTPAPKANAPRIGLRRSRPMGRAADRSGCKAGAEGAGLLSAPRRKRRRRTGITRDPSGPIRDARTHGNSALNVPTAPLRLKGVDKRRPNLRLQTVGLFASMPLAQHPRAVRRWTDRL